MPTLEGEDEVHLSPGTQTGETFTLLGHGLPDARTGVRGNQHITVRLITPRHLTDRQRELLAEYAGEGGEEVEEHRSWFERIRDAIRGEEDE